jgi:hypothetical protein
VTLLLWLGGCFHAGLHAHTGDLVEPRSAAFVAGGTALTIAPGEGQLATGRPMTATFGQRAIPHPLVDFVYGLPMQAQLGGRWGVARGLELDAVAGMQELGASARVALLTGEPVSASLDLGGGWRPTWPIELSGGPRATVGVAVSRRGRVATPLLDAQLSYGPEVYVAPLSGRLRLGCGSFSVPGCSEYGPPATFDVERQELRLTGAIGLSSATTGWLAPGACANGDCTEVVVAVEPYVTLLAGAPDLRAYGGVSRPSSFTADLGASLQVEVRVGGSAEDRSELVHFTDEATGIRYDFARQDYAEDGPYQSTFPDGAVRSQGSDRHGRKVGRWIEGYPGGATRSVVEWVRGRPWTMTTLLSPDGTPVPDAEVHQGTGTFVVLGDDGRELARGAVARGRREGPWVEADGERVDRGEYRRGRREGRWRSEGPDGAWDRTYRRGELEGVATSYGPDGGVTARRACHHDQCELIGPTP